MKTEVVIKYDNVLIINALSEFTSELYLRTSTGKTVKIGTLDKKTKELRVFKDRKKHEHHRTESYGFNYYLIANSKHIEKIRIQETNEGVNNTYLVPRCVVYEQGTVMKFIEEEQIFYPIYLLERYYKI